MEYVRFGELYSIPSSNGVSRPSAVRGQGYKMINMAIPQMRELKLKAHAELMRKYEFDGIDIDFGLTTTNLMEAQLNRVMMNAAAKTIVLADSSKFGKRGFSRICGIEDVDHIITDRNIPESYAKHITDMGIRLTIADVDSI
jgi:hypothetical protein